MKVILTQNVPKLGQAGDVKEVKKGYGFNYLLPEGLAELATPGALKSIKHIVARAEKEKKDYATELATAVQAVDGKTVTIAMKAKDGKLFGSVTKHDIVKALEGAVSEEMIELEHPIKTIGEFDVKISASTAKATVKLSVVSE